MALTATSGSEVYRGDKLPELRGDLFFGEPVGRIVRRARVVVRDGLIVPPPHVARFVILVPVVPLSVPPAGLFPIPIVMLLEKEATRSPSSSTARAAWTLIGW